MKTAEITCAGCGLRCLKTLGEVTRSNKLKRRLFCSLSCAAITRNAAKRRKAIEATCPTCKKTFATTTLKKAAGHCSRSCASAGSVNEARRKAARASGLANSVYLRPADALRSREWWKYERVAAFLNGRDHQFEFELDDYVFDLALLDSMTLVEFDGPEHNTASQRAADEKKAKHAESLGWQVVRRPVARGAPFDPKEISGL